MNRSLKTLSGLILSLTGLMGCSVGQQQTLEEIKSDIVGIFSNRPQNQDQLIAILKLKHPPLLKFIETSKGQRKINAEAQKALLAEQEQTRNELQKISSEIRVLFTYKMVLNGIAVLAPKSALEKLRGLGNVSYVEQESPFSRPATESLGQATAALQSSVDFIGTQKAHALKVKQSDGSEVSLRGQGVRVGIIDTGIDYTHSMLGGTGKIEDHQSVDPDKASAFYPNKKVVGGRDFVGTKFNAASAEFARHIPLVDENPMDEAGHGTHVAGTVAGLGDGQNTYDGVAPEAELYALKVFGKKGSTSDSVVVAALEYAADPTGTGDLSRQLDVVNLSLGSSYGNPHILYEEAIENLVQGGTVVVASAGNSGPNNYITGAPGTSDLALSVAASVDGSDRNWKFGALKFLLPNGESKIVERIEASISKPVSEAGEVTGPLVYIGLADKDLTEEQKQALSGKIALIDRGVVKFSEKLKRAEDAGAIGAIVANNQPGSPTVMGGDTEVKIPAAMISQDLGAQIKELMKSGEVTLQFNSPETINKPELIDTLTGFSSKGPRSIDSLLKPEISAPGYNVISAAVGKGTAGTRMNGTSMAAPHMAGVIALLKQAHPDLSALELKSLAMGRAKTIKNEKGERYPVTRQGSGRVQVYESVTATLVTSPTGISFGEINVQKGKILKSSLTVKSLAKDEQKLSVSFEGSSLWKFLSATTVTVPAKGSLNLNLRFEVNNAVLKDFVTELDGWILFKESDNEVFRVPVLAVAKKVSDIQAVSVVTLAGSETDAAGSVTEVTLVNNSVNSGDALIFNLLGKDGRKENPGNNPFLSRACDLQAAGYRVIQRSGKQILQVAAKVYEPMTTWNSCELSVLIDNDKDGVADQELAAAALSGIEGLAGATNENDIYSVLLDANVARDLRAKYETEVKTKEDAEVDYKEAVIDMVPGHVYNHSTVLTLEAEVSNLARRSTGELAIKVATIHNEASAVSVDDFLKENGTDWKRISLETGSVGHSDIPEKISLEANETKVIELSRGYGKEDLLILYPHNRTVFSDLLDDDQAQIIKPALKP